MPTNTCSKGKRWLAAVALSMTFGLRAQPEITAMIDMKNNYALPKL